MAPQWAKDGTSARLRRTIVILGEIATQLLLMNNL
jgi:hypothetical protein